MPSHAQAIENYIRAKDGNRPHLMGATFDRDAVLDMTVRTGAISFPPRSQGLDAISRVLVGDFGRNNENVYTFCLGAPPRDAGKRLTCRWLVGMSDKATGQIKIGWGSYDWIFGTAPHNLVERLTITIDAMDVLPAEQLAPVMTWLAALPYPWCPPAAALATMPDSPGLQAVRQFIDDCARNAQQSGAANAAAR